MSILIPRDLRRNPVSTAVWLASKRRNKLRSAEVDFLASASFIYIDATKAASVDGYSNWDKVSTLTYAGTNASGVDVSQATEANQPYYREDKTYTATGFDSVTSNEIALDGEGALIEAVSATNKNTNFNIAPAATTNVTKVSGDGAAPAVVAIPTVTGSDIFGASSDNGNLFELDCSAATGVTVYEVGGTTANTNAHSLQVVAYADNSGALFGIESNIAEAIPTGGFELIKQENQTPLASTEQLQISVPVGATVYFKYNQLEEAAQCSSLIEVSGSSAIRASDEEKVNTNEAFIDASPEITGSAGAISLSGTKYDTHLSASAVDARFINTDGTVSFITVASSSSITVGADVNAGATLVFTEAGYTTANMLALRLAVGDGSSFVGLPVNDFVWEIEFTALDNPTTGQIVENKYVTALDRNTIQRVSGGFRYLYDDAGATKQLLSSSTGDVSNRRWLIRVTKDSVNGTQLNVFEKDFIDSKSDVALTGGTPAWQPYKTYANREGVITPMNMILHRETTTNLDGSVVYQNTIAEGAS